MEYFLINNILRYANPVTNPISFSYKYCVHKVKNKYYLMNMLREIRFNLFANLFVILFYLFIINSTVKVILFAFENTIIY